MTSSQQNAKGMLRMYSGTLQGSGDCAYVEDTNNVEKLLQKLRCHVRTVKGLQEFSRSRLHKSGEDQDQQHQDSQHHHQLLQNELEEAWHVGSAIQKALKQLQLHVGEAESIGERETRQISFNRLLHRASQMLQQLRDAVDTEQWILQCQLQPSAPTSCPSSASNDVVPALVKTASTSHADGVVCEPLPETSPLYSTSRRQVEGTNELRLHQSPMLKCLPSRCGELTVTGKSSAKTFRDHVASTHNVFIKQEPPCSVVSSENVNDLSADFILPNVELNKLHTVSGPQPVFIPSCEVEASLLKEKRDALDRIQRDVTGIQSLYEQLALLAYEQGTGLESVGTRVSGARCQSSAASNILTATVTSQIRERKKKYINSLYQYLNKLSFNLSFHIHLDACLSENYFVAFQCQMAKFDAKYDTS